MHLCYSCFILHRVTGHEEKNWKDCPPHAFLCENKKCVTADKMCDTIDHCGDGSDEGTICDGND